MLVLGFDFTSRPTSRKPITCSRCHLEGDALLFDVLETHDDFDSFEAALRRSGSWVAGFDFPFGHSRRFVKGVGWPTEWPMYADHLSSLTRDNYEFILEDYKRDRPKGDKEHPRRFEVGTGAASPQKLYGVPVAKMLFEGVPRLRGAGLHLPGLSSGDPDRIGIEAYPGVLARHLIGKRSYKSDERSKNTPDRAAARRAILEGLRSAMLKDTYGLTVTAPDWLAEAPDADSLDSFLCAVQAAWAWRKFRSDNQFLANVDGLEGWIADPSAFRRAEV